MVRQKEDWLIRMAIVGKLMDIFVISLKRTPERLKAFRENNAAHPGIIEFEAVDGTAPEVLARLAKVNSETGLEYKRGAFGAALSHQALWQRSVSLDRPITICEDDAILHRDFVAESREVMNVLGNTWDFILWGWNFDSALVAEMYPSLSPAMMLFDQQSLRMNAASYVNAPIRATALRLRSIFGTPCYSLSPSGARAFLSGCFPLRNFVWTVPTFNVAVPNYGVDVAMCPVYQKTASYVCFPPLAVTYNQGELSTTRGT